MGDVLPDDGDRKTGSFWESSLSLFKCCACFPTDANSPALPQSATYEKTPDILGLANPSIDLQPFQSSHLRVFTYNELTNVTRNFCPENALGEGGFGVVYKGWISEKSLEGVKTDLNSAVAVKMLKPESFQGHREWLLIVPENSIPLPWATRIKIALGAAKGLAFLHELEKPIIYRDFKTSNILLDADYTAKLSDFGLAKAGPEGDQTHVSTRIMGTQGYVAPEYLKTGHLTWRSDVYSFGVVVLEMLTGRPPIEKTRGDVNLVEWAYPILSTRKKSHLLLHIIDPRLEGNYPLDGVEKVASLAKHCLHPNPKARPLMGSIVKALECLHMAATTCDLPIIWQHPSLTGTSQPEPQGFEAKGTGTSRPEPQGLKAKGTEPHPSPCE